MAVGKQVRDLEADLAICEAATPGPWRINDDSRYSNCLVWGSRGSGRGAIAEVRDYNLSWRDNVRFIAAAREGWPYAIRRALEAESEIDRLRNELNILQQQLYGSEVYES